MTTKTKRSKLVIFDYDGVLVDSLPVQFEIYNHLVKEMKLDPSLVEQTSGDGDFFSVDYRETLRKVGVNTPEGIKEAEEKYLKHIKTLRHKITPFDFVPNMLEELSKNYTLAIVSNNNTNEISKNLETYGLLKYFKAVIGPPKHKGLKPAPDQVIACLNETGFSADNALLIGDMNGDIQAAKNAGVASIAVTWGFHSHKKLMHADRIATTVDELIRMVNE